MLAVVPQQCCGHLVKMSLIMFVTWFTTSHCTVSVHPQSTHPVYTVHPCTEVPIINNKYLVCVQIFRVFANVNVDFEWFSWTKNKGRNKKASTKFVYWCIIWTKVNKGKQVCRSMKKFSNCSCTLSLIVINSHTLSHKVIHSQI